MARLDPHSYTDSSHLLVKHVALNLYFDFAANTIHGSALLNLPAAHTGHLLLDTRSLLVHSVLDPISGGPIPFSFPSSDDPVFGRPLFLSLSAQSAAFIVFCTSQSSNDTIFGQPLFLSISAQSAALIVFCTSPSSSSL